MTQVLDLASECGLEVIRAAAVTGLGLLLDRRDGVLAPLYDDRYLAQLEENRGISMVVTTPEMAALAPQDRGVAIASDPLDAFYQLHCRLCEAGRYWTSAPNAISPDARIHRSAVIADQDVEIGPGVTVGANAVIEARTIIGPGSTIGPGTVIGSEGYEMRKVAGQMIAVPHAGGVRIGRNVTIQANCVVARALFGGFTQIGEETALADLVNIGHESVIGRRCRIVGGVVIGGSAVLGDDCWVGLNATVSSAVRLGDRARVTMGAVVTRDVPPDGHVSGNFAIDHERLLAHLRSIR
jgi:UDP-3-O-[3-hydroxymyristoyl] glucosamine N-acyltransferase